jgi:hypothetical protein
MKAKIEVTIRDEAGNVIGQLEPQILEVGNPSLHNIEGAVEAWRKHALPDIEAELLNTAQAEFIEREKKQ